MDNTKRKIWISWLKFNWKSLYCEMFRKKKDNKISPKIQRMALWNVSYI